MKSELRYGLGLDIGIASVGWAVVALKNDNPYGIVDMGVRTFEKAENPKDGSSLAAGRRQARSARRRLRRAKGRKNRIKSFIVNKGIITKDALTHLYEGVLSDVYELRVKALDERVSPEEFARILIHISQRRGFKSNRMHGESKEDGKIIAAVSANKKRMQKAGYRTVAEMYINDEAYAEHRRNKKEDYLGTVSRDMVEDEVRV